MKYAITFFFLICVAVRAWGADIFIQGDSLTAIRGRMVDNVIATVDSVLTNITMTSADANPDVTGVYTQIANTNNYPAWQRVDSNYVVRTKGSSGDPGIHGYHIFDAGGQERFYNGAWNSTNTYVKSGFYATGTVYAAYTYVTNYIYTTNKVASVRGRVE